ncbi:hypothetical protein ACWCYZ_42150 [Streptomyces virginiae]
MLRTKLAMLAAGSAAALALGFAAPASAAPDRALADIGDFQTALSVKTGDVDDAANCVLIPAGTLQMVLTSSDTVVQYVDATCAIEALRNTGPGTFTAVGGFFYRVL